VVANFAITMKIAWLQPWSRRQQGRRTPTLAAAINRWPFTRRRRWEGVCALSTQVPPLPDHEEIPIQRVALSLTHHLDVSRATQYLVHHLDCDAWHVTCRHEHQMVVQLTRGGSARYGVSYDCSPPVEKAVYHGSRTWALTIIPLHGQDNLPAEKAAEIKAGLAELHG